MPADMTTCSAVIVAHDANMSIFKPVWLGRQGILEEEELDGAIVVTPALIRIPTDRFELLVLPDRIQMRPAKESGRPQANLLRVLGGIVSKLPHTPFTALGLNFEYSIKPSQDVGFAVWNREQFSTMFARGVETETPQNVRFGGYLEMDVLEMRLRVDLKPVHPADGDTESEPESAGPGGAMHAKFNFHRDLTEHSSAAEIFEILGTWDAAGSFASRLASAALGGCNEG